MVIGDTHSVSHTRGLSRLSHQGGGLRSLRAWQCEREDLNLSAILPELKLCTKFEVVSFNGCRNK